MAEDIRLSPWYHGAEAFATAFSVHPDKSGRRGHARGVFKGNTQNIPLLLRNFWMASYAK